MTMGMSSNDWESRVARPAGCQGQQGRGKVGPPGKPRSIGMSIHNSYSFIHGLSPSHNCTFTNKTRLRDFLVSRSCPIERVENHDGFPIRRRRILKIMDNARNLRRHCRHHRFFDLYCMGLADHFCRSRSLQYRILLITATAAL